MVQDSDEDGFIQSMINEIAELERVYGNSIRPAWVGEEIGILRGKISWAKKAQKPVVGDLDFPLENTDQSKRGFQPK